MKLSKKTITLIILILIGLLSVFLVSRIVTSPDFNEKTIESLDEKRNTVLKLTATAAASSTAITLIPGDVAMPIANQIADLTSYFVIILGAIVLEKMLLTVIGYISFTFIIPAACLLGIFYLYSNREILRNLAIKMAIFGLILYSIIPVVLKVSDIIDDTYQASINQTIEIAEENNDYIDEKKNDLSKEDQNWIENVSGYLSNLTSSIGTGISDMVKKGEDSLASFLDSIAVLIITTCVIPIVIILIFAWIIKILFGFDTNSISKMIPKNRNRAILNSLHNRRSKASMDKNE